MQDYCFVSLYMKNGLKQVENAESRLSIVKVEHMHYTSFQLGISKLCY